jgi:hypothetical protein
MQLGANDPTNIPPQVHSLLIRWQVDPDRREQERPRTRSGAAALMAPPGRRIGPTCSVPSVAGWDLDFDVAIDDEQLARDCFRILRRTCARFYLGFSYYEQRHNQRRIVFILVFDGRPAQLGLASADFVLEMRAVAMLQRSPRKRRLPLRLAHWITYSGSEEPLRLQPPSHRVPEAKHEIVVQHLTEYALAWGAWRRDELSPSDFLEAQHSLLTSLALDLADGISSRMPYPELIKALRVPERSEQACLDLGRDRNRVKHRGLRHEAERYVEKYEQTVYSVAHDVTGIDAMPRSAHMQRWEEAGERLLPRRCSTGGASGVASLATSVLSL